MPSRSILAVLVATVSAQDLATLQQGQVVSNFTTKSLYLDDSDKPLGARFIHRRTGLTLDLLYIDTAPQASISVNTDPVSDRGEPHTQEHLLLGHGNKGRNVAGSGSMALVRSTAFTAQRQTVYPFNTTAGADVFFDQMRIRLDAMLHPDYTDEEIRREVRNFGIADLGGGLRLEEKGSVYNEMVSSTTQPGRRAYYTMNRLQYGERHPLAFNAGGDPPAIREMKPEHIRAYRRDYYQLRNMAVITVLPRQTPRVLERMDEVLARISPPGEAEPIVPKLPKPQPAPEGAYRLVEFPHRSADQSGPVQFGWPPTLELSLRERYLLELFLNTFAGDATTNLYRVFVDSKTRKMETGARSVSGQVSDEDGHAIVIGLGDVTPGSMQEATMRQAAELIQQEAARVAGWADGSPELNAFNAGALGRLKELRRRLADLMNSPPQFGARGFYSPWRSHVKDLESVPGFRKQLTLKPLLDSIEEELGKDANLWRARMARWRIASAKPYIVAARPNPSLVSADDEERKQRIDNEVDRLRRHYGVAAADDAIRRYRADYDDATSAIEKQKSAEKFLFTSNPPMTQDDVLRHTSTKVAGVPYVESQFDSMTAGTVGIALRLDGVPEDSLTYLAMLPTLMRESGVVRDGKAISFEQMAESLRREVRSLTVSFATNPKTRRYELVVRGSGSNTAETVRAVVWMRDMLLAPNWRMDNASRLRDVLDQTLSRLRNTTQRAEETWVRQVSEAWRYRDVLLHSATSSFMASTMFAQRLRWMLGSTTGDGGMAPLQSDIPESLRPAMLAQLRERMRGDSELGPERAIAKLEEVRGAVVRRGNARLFAAGPGALHQAVRPHLAGLIEALPEGAPPSVDYSRRPRTGGKFAGLLVPNLRGGVVMHDTVVPDIHHFTEDSLLDRLSLHQFSGGGSHSAFMRTWGAGLAYSSGFSASSETGRFSYYAERCPEIPQTLSFVAGLIRDTRPDGALPDYALSHIFNSRAAADYESRAEAMASDLADGLDPAIVRRYRQAALELRKRPDLAAELHRRTKSVFSRLLPGLDGRLPEANYFIIGNEKQFIAYEKYLSLSEGPDTKVRRLYPSDFWTIP